MIAFEEHNALPMPPGAKGWKCSCGAEWDVDNFDMPDDHDRHRANALFEECLRLAKRLDQTEDVLSEVVCNVSDLSYDLGTERAREVRAFVEEAA